MSEKLNSEIAVIGIDIGKNSFHLVGQDWRSRIVLRQKWSRGQVRVKRTTIATPRRLLKRCNARPCTCYDVIALELVCGCGSSVWGDVPVHSDARSTSTGTCWRMRPSACTMRSPPTTTT